MKTAKKENKKRSSRKQDSALEEFDSRDLGESLKTYSNEGQWVAPKRKTKPTSIALSEETIQILRKKAQKKGIGYQTLLKMIVQEHLYKY